MDSKQQVTTGICSLGTIIAKWLPPEFHFLLWSEITKPSTCELYKMHFRFLIQKNECLLFDTFVRTKLHDSNSNGSACISSNSIDWYH